MRLVDSGIWYDDATKQFFEYGTSGGSDAMLPLAANRVTPRAMQAVAGGGGTQASTPAIGTPSTQAPLSSLAGLSPVTQTFQGPFPGSTMGLPLPSSQGGGLSGTTNPLGSTSAPGPDIGAMLAALAGSPQIQPAATPGPVTPQFVSAGPPQTLTPQQSQGLTGTYGASPLFNPTAPAVPQAPPGPPPGSAATPRPPAGPTGGRPDANVPGPPTDANTGLPMQNLDAAIAAAAGSLGGVVGPPASGSNQFPTVGGGQGYQSTFGLPIPRGGQGPQRRGY